jgi:hypothetical protein
MFKWILNTDKYPVMCVEVQIYIKISEVSKDNPYQRGDFVTLRGKSCLALSKYLFHPSIHRRRLPMLIRINWING